MLSVIAAEDWGQPTFLLRGIALGFARHAVPVREGECPCRGGLKAATAKEETGDQQNYIYKCGNLIFVQAASVRKYYSFCFFSQWFKTVQIPLSWRATPTFGMVGVADQGTVGQLGKVHLHLLGGSRAADRPRIHCQRQGFYTNSRI